MLSFTKAKSLIYTVYKPYPVKVYTNLIIPSRVRLIYPPLAAIAVGRITTMTDNHKTLQTVLEIGYYLLILTNEYKQKRFATAR